MSRTVYLARDAQILAALSDDENSDGKLRCRGDLVRLAPYYADETLSEWRADALHVFSHFVVDVGIDGDFEYNGSSSYNPGEREDSWVVAVYESTRGDFDGRQLDALIEHPDTIFHGYVEFVDQEARYQRLLGDLADLAEICPPSRIDKMRIAVGGVLDESRECNEPYSDIVDALGKSGWEYIACELYHRDWTEAA
jgi:hypothetical protein